MKKSAKPRRNPQDERIFPPLLAQPPAKLNLEQTAWILGLQAHDILILVSAGLLKPLGKPSRSGTKYFGTLEILNLAKDARWLAKATNAIHHKNDRGFNR